MSPQFQEKSGMRQRTYQINTANLSKLLTRHGWTLADLATHAVVSTRTIDSLMAGHKVFISTARKIAAALKVAVDAILEGGELPEQAQSVKKFEVVFKIGNKFDSFDESKNLIKFIKELCAATKDQDGIEMVKVQPGCVEITVQMSEADIARLCDAWLHKKFLGMNIIDITLPNDEDFTFEWNIGKEPMRMRGKTLPQWKVDRRDKYREKSRESKKSPQDD